MNHTRTSTRVAVFLLGLSSGGAAYAVDFPAQPLQTGVVQPAPNVIFILDDSLSMTTQNSQNGDELDTRLTWSNTSPGMGGNTENPGFPYSIPYTKNPLSYNPHTTYKAWATANTSNTNVERLADASYTAVRNSDQYVSSGGTTNFSSNTQTYYVPKPSADQTDQRQYYRYQILSGGNRLVRAEWVDTAPTTTYAMTTVYTATGITGVKQYWGNNGSGGSTSNGNGACTANTNNFRYTVPTGVTRMVITTTGATGSNANPELYVRSGSNNPCNTSGNYTQRSTNGGLADESLTFDAPTTGNWNFGVFNSAAASGGIKTFSGVTLTVQTSTTPTQATLGCSTAPTGTYGWKNCVDITLTGDTNTGVRTLDAEKQNYANWYQYHRTRIKTAKAGGSEAFATLDENYRVGLMGLYPTGSRQQVLNGSMANILPVDTDGGLFKGTNRKGWFDHLHAMSGQQYTPLRKALSAAGSYFTTARAYRSASSTTTTTYLACRQNFAILTTDGYWNNFNGEDPDSDYSSISGDEEDGSTITGPNGQSYKYERAAPYWYNIAGSDRNDGTTLADVAMHYWKTDLLTSDVAGYPGSAQNKVPFSVANPAFWQHMVTFGVGLGVRGKLTDAQVLDAVKGTGTLANGGFWPAPVHATNGNENPENVDDLRHASLNARGSFINANDSTQFANGIADALNRIGERRGSASNVLANSTSISNDTAIYQATYTAGAWRGELLAYPVSASGLGEPEWRAGEHIAAWGSRNIFTIGASGGSTFPTAAQLTALATPATTLGLPNATALANYLKGDPSREKRNGGVARDRVMRNTLDQIVPALLGDIVDSSPFYVADSRTIFVGANGGMLHAIDASNTDANATNTSGGGTERFTYVPRGVVMSQLAELADPLYGTTTTKPHRFFVDGPIVVSTRVRTPGKNYLVGALGRGGLGVYGLNVTNPAAFTAGDVLWDKTGSASAPANMGNVISEPLISKLNTGVTAAIVANGPNSSTGTASLFIINLDTGATIHEFDTSTAANGLSAPRAVDVNADGKVDLFFAGDLLGNLWRFDVSATSTSSWSFNKVFTATGPAPASLAQPISSAPGVARDPTTGKIFVYFGTGRYMTSADQSDTATQTYYGVIVGANGKDGTNLTRTDLQTRTIHVVVADSTKRRAFEPYEPTVASGKLGWYIDLNNPAGQGERVISAPLINDRALVFSSVVPPTASTVNSCDAGGAGYINALDAFSGTSLEKPFFAGTPTITDPAGNEMPTGSVYNDSGMPTASVLTGDLLSTGDSSGNTPKTRRVNTPGGSSTRRVSWRELLNDQ